MKKRLLILSFTSLLITSLTGCTFPLTSTSSSNQTSIVNQGEIEVYFTQTMIDNCIGIGENFLLKADVLNTDNKNIIWESSAPEIINVDNQGVIEGVSVGSATIYAISEADSSKNAGITITVIERNAEDKISVSLSLSSKELYVGETFYLTCTVTNAIKDGSVTWSSSDESIAAVNNGYVQALKQGEVLIKATSVENAEKFATCKITVKENSNNEIYVTIASLDSYTLNINESISLKAEVYNYKSNSSVTWSSQNNEIIEISQSGVATGKKEGTTLIYAYSVEDATKYTYIELTVVESKNGYTLVWKDDFEGTSLNENYWSYQIGDGSLYGIPGWGNSEEQYYQQDNVSLSDGNLVITAKSESVGGKSFTSGRIRTYKKVSYTYGRVEARIKLPTKTGLWPAFWLLPDNENYGSWPNSGEIDIMEAKGRLPYETSGALHYALYSGTHHYDTATNYFQGNESIAEYHIYAVEWDENNIRWYCDNNLFLSISSWAITGENTSNTKPFDTNFYIILNLACGGHFDNYTSPSTSDLPASMYVDYVKWYQK